MWQHDRADERPVKVRDVLRRLQDDGWYIDRVRGSHRQLKHPTKPGTVTVAGRPGVDVPTGTLMNIWRQAGLREDP
jgi:predicted RNA binding protein YcfA (HicA-like mRNA interferase family)